MRSLLSSSSPPRPPSSRASALGLDCSRRRGGRRRWRPRRRERRVRLSAVVGGSATFRCRLSSAPESWRPPQRWFPLKITECNMAWQDTTPFGCLLVMEAVSYHVKCWGDSFEGATRLILTFSWRQEASGKTLVPVKRFDVRFLYHLWKIWIFSVLLLTRQIIGVFGDYTSWT